MGEGPSRKPPSNDLDGFDDNGKKSFSQLEIEKVQSIPY